jgi:DNA-binding transcriptional LysR family regulator
MDRFRELETFVAVADNGSFSGAARALNMSPPAVTRQISSLEDRLGARLFVRTTRQVALTEAGERFYRDTTQLLSDLGEAEASAAGAYRQPKGMLRITAPVVFGQLYIGPILRGFLDIYADVSATTLFVDRIVDLIDEGLDVAVRIGNLPDSSLTALKVGTVRRVVVAAPSYLEAHGVPRNLADLEMHRIIQPSGFQKSTDWPFVVKGQNHIARTKPVLTVNTVIASIDAAQSGWGITRALSYQVAKGLADGSLVEVLEGFDDYELPIHLVHAEGRAVAAKTRAFVDFAAKRIRAEANLFSAKGRPEHANRV